MVCFRSNDFSRLEISEGFSSELTTPTVAARVLAAVSFPGDVRDVVSFVRCARFEMSSTTDFVRCFPLTLGSHEFLAADFPDSLRAFGEEIELSFSRFACLRSGAKGSLLLLKSLPWNFVFGLGLLGSEAGQSKSKYKSSSTWNTNPVHAQACSKEYGDASIQTFCLFYGVRTKFWFQTFIFQANVEKLVFCPNWIFI